MDNEGLTPDRATRLRDAVKEKYRAVSHRAHGHFTYPVGQESLNRLGYAREWLSLAPTGVIDRFVGVGNPFSIRPPRKAERVLDVGCGSGLDAFVAARLVGGEGFVVGMDLVPEMLAWLRKAQKDSPIEQLGAVRGLAEALPFEDASFDLVISNGVLNLVPDKDAAFREIVRVLKPECEFVAADLIVMESIPEEVLAGMDAWSS